MLGKNNKTKAKNILEIGYDLDCQWDFGVRMGEGDWLIECSEGIDNKNLSDNILTLALVL